MKFERLSYKNKNNTIKMIISPKKDCNAKFDENTAKLFAHKMAWMLQANAFKYENEKITFFIPKDHRQEELQQEKQQIEKEKKDSLQKQLNYYIKKYTKKIEEKHLQQIYKEAKTLQSHYYNKQWEEWKNQNKTIKKRLKKSFYENLSQCLEILNSPLPMSNSSQF